MLLKANKATVRNLQEEPQEKLYKTAMEPLETCQWVGGGHF